MVVNIRVRDVTHALKAKSAEALANKECPECGRTNVRVVQKWEKIAEPSMAMVLMGAVAGGWWWWNYMVCGERNCSWEERGE